MIASLVVMNVVIWKAYAVKDARRVALVPAGKDA